MGIIFDESLNWEGKKGCYFSERIKDKVQSAAHPA
jgi:hypothetical protein